MHSYSKYFPVRAADDQLDVIGVLYAGLTTDPQRHLLDFDDQSWSAGGMATRVAAMQSVLVAKGVGPGDKVALMLGNSPSHIALIYALILLGAVWVPVNTRFKSGSIDYLLGHCRPRLVVADPVFATDLEAACVGHPSIALLFSDALPNEHHGTGSVMRCDARPDWPLCLIYTSGTTGAPKGVIFTHRMMRIASESALIVANVREGDCLFLWEPLCHIGGAQMLLVPFMARIRLCVVTRFSVSRFWEQIRHGRCTQLHYLGGILDILMRYPTPSPTDHTLRIAWGAGVSASAWAPIRDRLGVQLRECYGMTEGASFATVNETDTPGSIGKPLPWLTVELLDDQDRPVPMGELGQIVVSSCIEGNFLPGYLDNPDASAQALRNGKLYTGDMARAGTDGNFYFVGRRTESMRVRGENVSAWEIERVILDYPGALAVAAIGIKSDIGEQEILLYVQWQENEEPSFERLSAWAGERLAAFQWPRYYQSIDHFELTPSERIRKHLLSRDIREAWDRQQ